MRHNIYWRDKMRITSSNATWQLGYLLGGVADSQPHATALIIGPQRRRVSYADLLKLVIDLCAALRRCGLRSGDVIALQSPNSIEFVVALLAAARKELVIAPLDPALPRAERRVRVNRIGARVTLT